jgi:MoaA/NifB/PqqE/SkfB family radical SAM enzyme
MFATSLAQLGLKHAAHSLGEFLHINTNMYTGRPLVIRASINQRCNYRCQMCDFWRLPVYKDEMSLGEWQAALLSVKAFIGSYAIHFAGGEPFIKKGFVDLLGFCAGNGIRFGVITNGSRFTKQVAAATVAATPLNVDISVDGPCPEVHDTLRGVPGSFSRIVQGLGHLLGERDRQGHDFPIRIKPTVNALNFPSMTRLVEWTVSVGATSIDFEPLRHWTQETREHLWIGSDAIDDLHQAIEDVIAMKRAGAPIETSEAKLRNFVPHFRGEKVAPELTPCRVGLRDFHIRCDGNVVVCWKYPPLGNIKHQTAREIWLGPRAQEIRRQTLACQVGCAYSCLAHRSLKEQLKRGVMLVKRLGATN